MKAKPKSTPMTTVRTVELAITYGVEGPSVYLNEIRIAGPKPWGGCANWRSWQVRIEDVRTALRRRP